MTEQPKDGKSRRGFASMSPEKRRELAAKGGKAVAPEKRSFSVDKKLAKKAGRKGGANIDPKDRSFSTNPELARAAGRKGGSAIKPAIPK